MIHRVFIVFACLLVLTCTGSGAKDLHEISHNQEIDQTRSGMVEERIVVDHFELTIPDSNAECVVHYRRKDETGAVKMNITPPCVFAVGRDGKIRSEKTKWGWSLILVSSKKSANKEDCITQLQGILVGKKQVMPSPTRQRIALCGHGPWDQKLYMVFAAQTAHSYNL